MAETTEISWCDHTINLWWGCTRVTKGCDRCYAETLSNRWGKALWGNDAPRRGIKAAIKDANRFQLKAKEAGVLRTVFLGSMMDIFEKPMPVIDNDGNPVMIDVLGEQIQQTTGHLRAVFFDMISAGMFPNLIFLMLTKRPSNINKYIPKDWLENGAPWNVWFGTSPVDQETADKLIPQLLGAKGRNLFLSCEPLLGSINLDKNYFQDSRGEYPFPYLEEENRTKWLHNIPWVIVGGESGHGARPMHPQWARDIRDQCIEREVAFHFKQFGEYGYIAGRRTTAEKNEIVLNPDGHQMMMTANPDAVIMSRMGKKLSGHLLDGIEYQEFPDWEAARK